MGEILMLFPGRKLEERPNPIMRENEGGKPMNDLRPFCCGERLLLRNEVYAPSRDREWLFFKREGEKILLEHKTKGYVWEALMDDIDWEAYRNSKGI